MSVLPKEINYSQRPISLPKNTQCISCVVAPSNGGSFGESQQIQFDLPSRGYLVPDSVYLRYKQTYGASTTASIRGVPVYTPIQRLETIIGASVVESITNYNQLMNMLVNCRMNIAQKVGVASGFGIGGTNVATAVAPAVLATAFTLANVNGRLLVSAADNFTVAGPLGCILSNCDTLYPLKFSPAVRIQLTTETIANMCSGGVVPASVALTNLELCFDIIEFNQEVDNAVSSMVDERGKIMIKSQSYLSSGQNIVNGSVGSLEYIYNFRLASIKSLFCHLSGTHTNSLNKFLDSLDITNNNGAYQFYIASSPYPPRPISTVLNKSGVLMELSGAFGPAHDLLTSNFGIYPDEFQALNISTTTIAAMGKFYVGVNTERLSSQGVMLSGVSSQNSPISLRIDLNTATTNTQVAQLIALFDAVIEIDVANKQVSVLQ